MSVRYYRCDWESADEANPTSILYEVDRQDLVTRSVNLFADGDALGQSTSDFPDGTAKGTSLVDGTFARSTEGMTIGQTEKTADGEITLREIDRLEFDAAWELTLRLSD
ncbi:MAG: hypothetical protein JWM33_2378 [Caulobacteraceae bacterium]|nr:hypothetical protein [Caulobacteraceae bacterium]